MTSPTGSLPLSVLDLSPVPSGSVPSRALHETVELARTAERLGYARFWVAEHHNLPSVASSAPAVMMATVAAATHRIRIGAGGFMLPNHSPLAVAETIRVLGGLHPDRIDLGVGRAPGADQLTALALRRSPGALAAEDFPDQFTELMGYLEGFHGEHRFASVRALPDDVPPPPVWILGSSTYGARAAAAFGTGFAFAGHFGAVEPAQACTLYREAFQPSGRADGPHVILALAAIVADDERRAEELALAADLAVVRLRTGRIGPLPSPREAAEYAWTAGELELARDFRRFVSVGTPEQVREQLSERAERAGADELIITTMVHDPAERRHSYELLADAFALAPSNLVG